MENDTIYFLIIWLLVMFCTLAAGILFIMFQVRCFPCQNNEVAVELMKDHHHGRHHSEFHTTNLESKHCRSCVVCGEVMSTEEEGEFHQSCHDVDVMCV